MDATIPLRIESLGVPIRAARAWTSALAPNARGGWNFITQAYEFRSDSPSEFVVVDLETGRYSISEGPPRAYSAKGFQAANQLRAANGRIFFPQSEARMAYYDPTDEVVRDLGRLAGLPDGSNMIYSATFGGDGKLYGGTQGSGMPTIVQIDPDKLTSRVLGRVGGDPRGYSYAYELAVDLPWIYVAVGQSPWELAALNVTTGESKVLATRTDDAWLDLEAGPNGVTAIFITGKNSVRKSKDVVWCVDGKLVRFDASARALPFKSRDTTPRTHPLPSPPELDLTRIGPDHQGVGRIAWRRRGTDDWKIVEYRVQYTSPIDIDSLIALPDGSVLGSSAQYHGFFRYYPERASTVFMGPHGPSRAVPVMHGPHVYFAGYPNGVLYRYDPAKPWTAKFNTQSPTANPVRLGHFKQAGTKYASFLHSAGDRIYYLGRRERDGTGSGVGYYDPREKKLAGHHEKLAALDARGLVVIESPRRIVVSGGLLPGSRQPVAPQLQAELVIFDPDLKEIERQVVRPAMHDTGKLFTTFASGVIVGVVTEPGAVYRYDVNRKQLLAWNDIDARVGSSTQRADGSIWIVVGSHLARIDPVTLQMKRFGGSHHAIERATHLTWQGDDLYFSFGPELMRVHRVGVP